MKVSKILIPAMILFFAVSLSEAEAQTVSLKYKPDYIGAIGNNAVIRVITPKPNAKRKIKKVDDEWHGEIVEKKRETKENEDGSATEIVSYNDGSTLEETTFADGTKSKTTISANGKERITTYEDDNGYKTETNTTLQEEKRTVKVITTVTTRNSSGEVVAETTKERVVEK